MAKKKNRSLKHILSLWTVLLVMLSALLGIVFSGLSVSKKINYSNEFVNSYNIRYQLDLDPYINQKYNGSDSISDEYTADDISKMVDETADAFAKYLTYIGVQSDVIYTEFYPNYLQNSNKLDPNNTTAYISTSVANLKIDNPLYKADSDLDYKKEKKVWAPKQYLYYQYKTNYDLTLALYNYQNGQYRLDTSVYIADMFDFSKMQIDYMNDKYWMTVPLKANATAFDDIIAKFQEIQGDNTTTDEDGNTVANPEPFMIVYRDLDGLFDYLNYINAIYNQYIDYKEEDRTNVIILYESMSDAERDYVKANNPSYSNESFSPQNGKYNTILANKIDTATALIYDLPNINGNNNSVPIARTDTSFLNRYLLSNSLITKSNFPTVDDEEDSNDNGDDDSDDTDSSAEIYFPEHYPNDKNRPSHNRLFSIPLENYGQSLQYKKFYQTIASPLKFKMVSTVNSASNQFWNNDVQIKALAPKSSNNIVGFNALMGIYIAIIVLVLIVGLIVSILYRWMGITNFILSLVSLFGTLAITVASGINISTGVFIALIVGLFANTFVNINFLEMFKKKKLEGSIASLCYTKIFKKTISTSLNIYLVLILVALAFTYFGQFSLIEFGSTLIYFVLLSLGINVVARYAFNFLLVHFKLFEKNSSSFASFNWMKANPKLPPIIIFNNNKKPKTNFVTPYWSKANLFNKKNLIIISVITVLVIALGFSLIYTVGFNATEFHNGTRIVIDDTNGILASNPTENFNSLDWYQYSYYDNTLYLLVKGQNIDKDAVWAITSGLGIDNSKVSFQLIDGSQLLSYVTWTIAVLAISAAFALLYGLIRMNVVSILPIFFGLIISPLMVTSLFAISQIPTNQNIVYAFVTTYCINAILVINLVSNINDKWQRRKHYTRSQIATMINEEIKSFAIYLIIMAIMIATLAFTSGLFFGVDYSSLAIGLIFYAIIMMWFAVLPTAMFHEFGIMVWIHYSIRIDENMASKKFVNYDKIDEQLIESINSFKYKISIGAKDEEKY